MQSLTRTAHTCGKEVSRNQEAQHPTAKHRRARAKVRCRIGLRSSRCQRALRFSTCGQDESPCAAGTAICLRARQPERRRKKEERQRDGGVWLCSCFPGHQHATSLGAQKTDGHHWQRLHPSLLERRNPECTPRIAWSPWWMQQGQVQMALCVIPGLSANSAGDKTVRPCETCEGGSRFWALLQHLQEEARSSKTQRYDEGCLLDSPCLNGLQDLFLAMSGAHDRSPIWSFTYPQVSGAVQRAASEAER